MHLKLNFEFLWRINTYVWKLFHVLSYKKKIKIYRKSFVSIKPTVPNGIEHSIAIQEAFRNKEREIEFITEISGEHSKRRNRKGWAVSVNNKNNGTVRAEMGYKNENLEFECVFQGWQLYYGGFFVSTFWNVRI